MKRPYNLEASGTTVLKQGRKKKENIKMGKAQNKKKHQTEKWKGKIKRYFNVNCKWTFCLCSELPQKANRPGIVCIFPYATVSVTVEKIAYLQDENRFENISRAKCQKSKNGVSACHKLKKKRYISEWDTLSCEYLFRDVNFAYPWGHNVLWSVFQIKRIARICYF